jgi:hypothetical protein
MTSDIFPADRFYCVLDDQPDHLVPPRLLGESFPAGGLIVNPCCWFSWQGPLPPDKSSRIILTENFFDTPWMIWVDDPATSAVWPFWLGPQFAHALYDLAPGQPLTRELPPEMMSVLCTARVFVTPNYAAQRRQDWQRAVRVYSGVFRRGYVTVPNLLHPFHVSALRRYYRYHTRHGSFALGDGQTATRFIAHNESVTRFFHYQLTNVLSDIAGTIVKPSYSYLALYQEGSVLDKHVDRDECEYSITSCIDATPEPVQQVPWPLELDTCDGSLRIWQHIGDSLIYRGRYLPHSRDRLAQGYTSSSILFHYVDADFGGPLS